MGDKKKIEIEEKINYEEFWDELEKAIAEKTMIIIECEKDNVKILHVLAEFYKKYSQFVKEVQIKNNKNKSNIIIRLIKQIPECKQRGYKLLKKDYNAAYYLNDCGGYKDFKLSNGKILDIRLQKLLYFLDPQKDDIILDVGCGRGEFANAISHYCKKVIAIDYSNDAISIAKKTFGENERVEFICGDIMELEPKKAYDKIIMADVFEHIEQNIIENLLCRISEKLLKRGGVLLIHTAPNLDYYEKVYTCKVKKAEEIGMFLPQNPRSAYEQMMHINEQTVNSMDLTLKKFFLQNVVWTGNIKDENYLINLNEQEIGEDITAIAGNGIDIDNIYMQIMSKPLKTENLFVELKCCVSSYKVRQGEKIICKTEVVNKSPYIMKSLMPNPVRISYHIYSLQGETIQFDGERTDLPCVLHSGDEAIVEVKINTSCLNKGKYNVMITFVQELCFWFNDIFSNNKEEIEIEIV